MVATLNLHTCISSLSLLTELKAKHCLHPDTKRFEQNYRTGHNNKNKQAEIESEVSKKSRAHNPNATVCKNFKI